MSSKEQKTPEGQAPEEIIMDQHEEVEAVESDASAEQVDPRDEKIANLEAQLTEAQTRERDAVLRIKAEMENLRRRTELDVEKAHKFALEKFAGDLLAVVDTLERGLEMSDPNDEAIKPMREGMELTLKMFDDTLRRYQVEALNPEGEPFNPEQHQAMAMQESASAEPGSVLKVFQKGYLLNGRLLRPAMVVVSKAPAETPPSIDEQA